MGKRKGRKRKPKRIRHRSPVAPPTRVIDKKGYRRADEKRRVRKRLREEL